ncbi:MAG TPA: response regulator transcription factor [Pyrinomonadaceae bacterium]|nr:response regulator transcription factor [Chloracidobacterium sp.]MBP9934684.1 response regulator transcription factor [Pyrinomonadaceae bacterium]MBK7804610.1 response regulator transcription factor [Chloracidobacterium sp.]MBK9439065.1 response regulator transcription factor [Chloracidobacterium sp.]MBL0240530.1 response regulator transcription factor [Chloracidobacterium sp.]
MKILLVEDEPGLILTLTDRLVSEGFDVTSAADGKAGFETAIAGKFDLMILDVMLPKKNGYDVARDLRQKGVETPILMLTAKGETIDKVLGLKLGADDYLTKPFEVIELLARIEALLRRSPNQTNGTTADVFRFGTVTIDFKRAEVSKGKARVDLSAMEFKLLHYLIENRGNVHSRDHLLDAVWGYDAMPTTRTVDVHIAWLRQKLEENPRHPHYIQTVHGLGYKFAA